MRLFPLLLFSLLLSLSVYAPAQTDAPQIIVATDLHFIAPELTDGGAYFTRMIENADGKVTAYTAPLTDAFISEVIAQRPECLILCGDLTFNGARLSHVRLAKKLNAVYEAGIPVYVIPGNHDVNSGAAASFSGDGYARVPSVTPEEFARIYEDFGYGSAIARDAQTLSYVAEPIPGVRVVMLDVNSTGNLVPDETFDWLEKQLQSAKKAGAKVIAVSHQNLYAHSDLLSRGFVIGNAERLQNMYANYGVRVNLSGHMHIQHIIAGSAAVPEIAGSSLCVSPCQYGVIELDGSQAHYRTREADVPAWAKAAGQTDANLLDFDGCKRRFFTGRSREKTMQALVENEKAADMADFFVELNAAYFAGRLDAFEPDPDIAALWLQQPESFSTLYIASMLREGRKDHTKLDFAL